MKAENKTPEKKPSVVIVDDQLDNIRVLGSILTSLNLDIRPFTDPQEGLASIFAAPPDLILLDILMPHMDGYEVCRRIKASKEVQDIPVIFLTAAFTRLEDMVRGFEVGAVDYITKPVDARIVTVRVTTHINLSLAKKTIAEENSFKNKLISLLAHDLRNPLGGVAGLLQLIRTEPEQWTREELFEAVEQMYLSIAGVQNLLENLMGWADLVRAGIMVSSEPVNLIEVIEEHIQALQVQAEQKGVSLEIRSSDNFEVTTDRHIIGTIVRNLTANAVKFAPPGEGEVVIILAHGRHSFTVTVQDNGIGMSEEEQADLFSHSARARRGTAGEKGSGFGLLVCLEMTRLLGGTIDVKSEQNAGSEFIVRIPV